MVEGVYPLAGMMVNELNRADRISNNIANANTPGYKQEKLAQGSFNNYLRKAIENKEPINRESHVINTVPSLTGAYVDASVGSISPTGNNLDFALTQPNTFFKLKDKLGNEFLTRGGSFKALDNVLVTQEGHTVLTADGRPIEITEPNFQALIGVFKSEFTNLHRIGQANHSIDNRKEVVAVEDNTEYIQQGAMESSNSDTMRDVVDLLQSHREFASAQKAITGIDEITGKVIDRLGGR
jgi:flagellar basal-body rod protein FlgF